MSTGAAASAGNGTVRYAVGDCDTRPWGRWEVVATGDRYTVKRITVLPGQRLSLQYHHHRSEHWTMVEGEAEVEIDGAVHRLGFGEHVHIPLGAKHRSAMAAPRRWSSWKFRWANSSTRTTLSGCPTITGGMRRREEPLWGRVI
jgi:mannose-6-phosphate isomerase-like protein (cupin superfamily)